jgi:hypothetical protein
MSSQKYERVPAITGENTDERGRPTKKATTGEVDWSIFKKEPEAGQSVSGVSEGEQTAESEAQSPQS